MSREKIVEALNKDRADELAAIIQYMGITMRQKVLRAPQ